jgi:hypothetical protein
MELVMLCLIIGIVLVSIWETIWKAFGMWHSAKNDDKLWFVLIMILNTLGILPIIYLYTKTKFFKKKKKK